MNKPIRLDAQMSVVARFVRHCACLQDVRPLGFMGLTFLFFCLGLDQTNAMNCTSLRDTYCQQESSCKRYSQDSFDWNINSGLIELTEDVICKDSNHGLFHARLGDNLTIIGNGHTIDVSGCAESTKCRAISVHDGAFFSAFNVTIKGGQAPTGGGIWIGEKAKLLLNDVTFKDNHAYNTNTNNGKGGAIWIWPRSDTIDLSTVRFEENTATNGGDAISTESGVIIDDCNLLTQEDAIFEKTDGLVSHPTCQSEKPTTGPTGETDISFPFEVKIDDECSGEWSLVDDILCYGVVQEAYFKALRPNWAHNNHWAKRPFQLKVDTPSILKTCPPSQWPLWQHGGAYAGIQGLLASDAPDFNIYGWQAMPDCKKDCIEDGKHIWNKKYESYNCLPHYHRFDKSESLNMLFWYGTYGTLEENGEDMAKWVSWNENKMPGESTYYKKYPHLVAERKQVYDPRILSGQNYFVFPVKPSGASLCQKTTCGPGYYLHYDIVPEEKNVVGSVNDIIAYCSACPKTGNHLTSLTWGSLSCHQLNCTNGQYLHDNTRCLDCPEGFYCPPSSADPPQVCPIGNWCPAKVQAPIACPAGSSTLSTHSSVDTDCNVCTPGYYCLSGQATLLCDPGYYCPRGSTNATGWGLMKGLLANANHTPTTTASPTASPTAPTATIKASPTQCNVSIDDLRNHLQASSLTCGTQRHIEVNCTSASETQVVPTEAPTWAPTAPAYQHLLQTLKQGERAYTVFITLDMTKMQNDLQQAHYNNCAEQEIQMIKDATLPIWDSILIDSVFRSDVHPTTRQGLIDYFKTENTTLYLLKEDQKVIESWNVNDYYGEITEYSNNNNMYSISFQIGSRSVDLSTEKNMCILNEQEPIIRFELPPINIDFESSLINTYNSGSGTNVLENLFTESLKSTEQPVKMNILCMYGGYELSENSCDVSYSVDSKIDFETRQYVEKSGSRNGEEQEEEINHDRTEQEEEINHGGTDEDQGNIRYLLTDLYSVESVLKEMF